MKEKDFDQYVKDLLQDAEVEVSPRVWKGIAAQIGARPARVFPVWGWALASVAAAVVAFVVLRVVPTTMGPSVSAILADNTYPENSVKLVSPAQKLSVPGVEAVDVNRLRVVAIESARLGSGRVEGKALQPSARIRGRVGAENLPSYVDASYFNQLAFADRKAESSRGLSLVASGDLQGNQRGQINGVSAYARPYSAPPLGADEGIYNETPESNFRLPVSIGLGVRYNFTSRWAVGTGFRYTNLGRTFVGDFVSGDGITIPQTDIDNQQHWIGIPVNLYYDIVNRGRWRVHGFVGGSAEFLFVNDFLIHYSPKDLHYTQRGTTPQWSAGVGLGVEFRLTPRVGIYLDPSARYYFNSEQQPRSLRTIQPLRFDVEMGLRFSLGQQ